MTIERLSRDHKAEAVEVLAAAFHEYPVMRFVLRDAGEAYEARLRALVGFFCELRFTRDFPVLGLRDGGGLAAVAGINDPEPGPWPPALEAAWAETGGIIGRPALDRLERFEATGAGLEPKVPHYYLGIIGVRPDLQGRGLARILIDGLIGMSREHPRSEGITLTTESPGNVPLYRRFGFEVVGEADIDELHTWVMFRADG